VAKTADRTFCFASEEDTLKDAISRLDRKERAELSEDLQAEISAVSGGDFYLAGTDMSRDELPFAPKAFHVQAWLGSSLEVQARMTFAKVEDAEKARKMVDAGLAMADDAPEPIKNLLEGVTVEQSGKYIYSDGKWKTKDLKAMLADDDGFPMPF